MNLFASIFLLITLILGQTNAHAMDLPVIKRSGVLPVEWINTSGLSQSQKQKAEYISKNFREIVYSSKRFRFANDEMIDLYAFSKDGRETLKSQYEVNSLIGMNAKVINDLVELQLFLSDMNLDPYLSESERISLNWIENSSAAELNEKVTDLAFSMLNRYPADVFVNSIQGKYLVLSAGKEQNLTRDTELEFYDIKIDKINPANGTWINYKKTMLGVAKVIDVKNFTAIAEIVSQVKTDAIRVESAAKIKDIPTREKFAYANLYTEYQDKEPEVIEVTPKYSDKNNETELVVEEKIVVETPKQVPKDEETKLTEKAGDKAPETVVKKEVEPVKEEKTPTREVIKETKVAEKNDAAIFPDPPTNLRVGIEGWNAKGKASASSSFAPWIINRIEGETKILLTPEISYKPTVGISFGKTGSGSYTGLNVDNFFYSPVYMKGKIPTVEFIEVGGMVELETMGINGESFGGYDALAFGILGSLNGLFTIEELGSTFKYKAGLGLNFFGFGQMGISGSKESISGITEFNLSGELISDFRIVDFNLGGFMKYNSKALKYQDGEVKLNMFTIALTASMEL